MNYDIVIVGCGPAGMTAGIYAGRLGLKTAIFEAKQPGGAMATAHIIENYPGFELTNGTELTEKMLAQVKKAGVEVIMEGVISIVKNKKTKMFEVTTDRKNIHTAKAIILATGGEYKKLGIDGEQEFFGRGVSYCVTCDGPLFKGKNVAVIGGGDTAIKGALYLADICKNVYVIHRRNEFRAEAANVEQLKGKSNVQMFLSYIPLEIKGDNVVRSLRIQSLENEDVKELLVDGIFVCVGEVPLTILAQSLGVKLNEKGEVIVDDNEETNIKGVWAAGDITRGPRQIITACGEGAKAAIAAYSYVTSAKAPALVK
jgi:thioredoxin reductase (NADPH)